LKNLQAARVFENIAALMEIAGESPFKVKAYRNAAETFASLTDELEQLAARGELRSIPGVGEAIEKKTLEILETGTCALYERLKQQFPLTILELLELPGVGARTVRALYEGLGVDSLEALEKAAREGRVRQLPRMGARAEERILESIRRLRARPSGIPLARALPLAEAIASRLACAPGIAHAVAAGGARRYAELTSRITVAAVAEDPQGALQAFLRETGATLLENGPERVLARLPGGEEAECFAGRPEDAGAALVRATGSEAHLVRLEALARDRSLTFEGTRLLDSRGEPVRSPDEESFYAALGMGFVPPELREDRGEVEAALRGDLPELVQVPDLKGDLHAHTVFSDGGATLEQMATAAQALGYEYLAITDHSQALTVARGLTPERLREQGRLIDAYNGSSPGIRLLKGVEVDIRADGTLDMPDAALSELDWVVASIHSHFALSREEMTARAVRALSSPFVHVQAHPTGRLIGSRDPHAVDVDALIEAAARAGKALEINSYPERLDLSAENARRAADAGVKIVVATDSHHPAHLQKISYGIGTARRAGLTRDDVLNTLPLDALLEWARSRS
jgi:DNA polymerase (family 10)